MTHPLTKKPCQPNHHKQSEPDPAQQQRPFTTVQACAREAVRQGASFIGVEQGECYVLPALAVDGIVRENGPALSATTQDADGLNLGGQEAMAVYEILPSSRQQQQDTRTWRRRRRRPSRLIQEGHVLHRNPPPHRRNHKKRRFDYGEYILHDPLYGVDTVHVDT